MSENKDHTYERIRSNNHKHSPTTFKQIGEGNSVKERTKRPDKPLYVPRALREEKQKNEIKVRESPNSNKMAGDNQQNDKKRVFKPPNQSNANSMTSDNRDKISKLNGESCITMEKSFERKAPQKVAETNCTDEISLSGCVVIADFSESEQTSSSVICSGKESIEASCQHSEDRQTAVHKKSDPQTSVLEKINSKVINEFTKIEPQFVREDCNEKTHCNLANDDELNDDSIKFENDILNFRKEPQASDEKIVEEHCIQAKEIKSSEVYSKDFQGEESWETMFNDDGECLNPEIIKELCDVTGRIKVKVAKNDYSEYQSYSGHISKEYDNVVELFGFPPEFSTQDLVSAFSLFQQANYTIKWVDDCHALAIFSSSAIANQALQMNHPFVKVRPLSEGIKESKAKARFCARHAEPQRPRPVTSATLARRLVSGALGLKVHTSKEQRDVERNILREAKERKKLKAKQRQDIWNGIVS